QGLPPLFDGAPPEGVDRVLRDLLVPDELRIGAPEDLLPARPVDGDDDDAVAALRGAGCAEQRQGGESAPHRPSIPRTFPSGSSKERQRRPGQGENGSLRPGTSR